jgi:membrane protease YdiL (CAAX protease family)
VLIFALATSTRLSATIRSSVMLGAAFLLEALEFSRLGAGIGWRAFRTVLIVLSAAVCFSGPLAVQVIAAPQVIDQSSRALEAPTNEPANSSASQPNGIDSANGSNAATLLIFALGIAGLGLFFARGWHRLASAPIRPIAFSPVVALSLLLVMLFSGRAGVGIAVAVFQIDLSQNSDPSSLPIQQLVQLAIGSYALQMVIVPFYIWLRMTAPAVAPDRRLGRMSAAVVAALTLPVAWPLALMASVIFSFLIQQPPQEIAHDVLRRLIEDELSSWSIIMAGLAIFIAPLVEELAYRGILQYGLVGGGIPRWIAICGTSIVFAAMHWDSADPNAVIALFVLSLGLGWVYEKTGRLTAPIVMHMLFNAGNFAMASVTA